MGTTANATHREPWNKVKIVGRKAPFKRRRRTRDNQAAIAGWLRVEKWVVRGAPGMLVCQAP
jgi:hypothetical protein